MIDLSEVERHVDLELIPRALADEIRGRAEVVLSRSIEGVERASGVPYPNPSVAPYLLVLVHAVDVSYESNVYARNLIRPSESKGVEFSIEFTAPLLLYGSRDTIDAVAAHELLHYLVYMKRFYYYGAAQGPIPADLEEALAIDEELEARPEAVFRRRSRFTGLLRRKFAGGLRDPALERKVERYWVGRGLPTFRVSSDENVVRVPAEYMARFSPDPAVLKKLEGI